MGVARHSNYRTSERPMAGWLPPWVKRRSHINAAKQKRAFMYTFAKYYAVVIVVVSAV